MSPFLSANIASSKGLTIAPRVTKSRSPPFSAEPGSCEFLRATSAKVAGAFFTSASSCSALAFALARSPLDMLAGAVIKMWLARRSSLVPKRAVFCS
ncbi:hypothetical protein D3C72_1308180 [compost metagenome]